MYNMLQRHVLSGAKAKKRGARAERARRGFFLPEEDILSFSEHNVAVLAV